MSKYTQDIVSGKTRFDKAPVSEVEFSIMSDSPMSIVPFDGGEIIPIYTWEVLPHDTFKVDMDFVIRQTTSITPVMGQLVADFYAFFVPNRVVNASWKNVMGENTSGKWAQTPVSLAPLVGKSTTQESYKIPIRSVADYYGFPTQYPIPVEVLQQCHDLKFRGYISIYNSYFRSQAYDPPIPVSKLNVFQGFFNNVGAIASIDGDNGNIIPTNQPADGTLGAGAVVLSVMGEGGKNDVRSGNSFRVNGCRTTWCALGRPLKANKLHDWFTSVLPTPQKAQREVKIPLYGKLPIDTTGFPTPFESGNGLKVASRYNLGVGNRPLIVAGTSGKEGNVFMGEIADGYNIEDGIFGTNMEVDLQSGTGVELSVNDMRLASSVQRIYELLGRGGSRYHEFVKSFFNVEVDDPFADIPRLIGHFRRDLDLYQTAQTSATESNGSPQGNLSAFGYTNKGGNFFHEMFYEHGYIHCFVVVRHKNVYSSYLAPDNFRMNMLDFYHPQLANLSEQPVRTRSINPFNGGDKIFGYNEAWSEYRYDVDTVCGELRCGLNGDDEFKNLEYWTYADPLVRDLEICDTDWLKSNTAEVVRRTTALTERDYPQFKGQFFFKVIKERPMPIYSVPGNDIF